MLTQQNDMHALGQDWLLSQGNMPGAGRKTLQFRGDHAVVSGSGCEDFHGKLHTPMKRRAKVPGALELGCDQIIATGIVHPTHALKLLSPPPHHAYPPDLY